MGLTIVSNGCVVLTLLLLASSSSAGDWARFRGPNGAGVSPDEMSVPVEWNETKNLKWKAELPGPGLSSPIVVGSRLYVTCWSGYGVNAGNPGDQKDLKRHLLSINRETGKIIWEKTIDAVLPEDAYRGMFAENGYASHTPVSDGERVYVFFGKSGVLAFDLEGKQLWKASVGVGSGPKGWGSSSSPVLYKNTVIVTASAESEAIVALDKTTGNEVWRQEASGFSGTWGTPILVDVNEDRQDLVIAVPEEVWGLNPENGKLRWYSEGILSNSMCASVVAHDGIVYALGGRQGGAIAVRAGGKGDVTKTHVVWRKPARARIGTPLFHEGRLHWISRGIANCIDARTGESVYRSRLSSGRPAAGQRQADKSRENTAPRRGRRRGGRGGQNYSSPVIAGGKIYYFTRAGDGIVLKLGSKFEQLARNRFGPESGQFSATPAISNGEMFVRSSKSLFCIAAKD